jgi:hypothetical protein
MRLHYYLIQLETVRSISSNKDTVVVITFLVIRGNTEVLLLSVLLTAGVVQPLRHL